MGGTHSPLDLVWVLICSALVMLMQGGFCFLESGLARSKSSINVAIKNLFDFCIAGLAFWLIGFGIMFGQSEWGIIGLPRPLLTGDVEAWTLTFFIFQFVFCGTATTIVSGAVAERMRFAAYLCISLLVSAILYPVFGHWAWGGADGYGGTGWLAELGFIDFAGSTVVHSVGGWISLAAVLLLGARVGRFGNDARPMHGHNLPMATIGVMLLWFGWFGFNGGSTLSVTDKIPLILLNTNLGAVAGGIAALGISWLVLKRPDVTHLMTGVVAGLVGITAGCHIIDPWAAVVIGATSAILCFGASLLLEKLQVDDVVNAWPTHAVAGMWGTISLAIFASPESFGTGLSRWEQLGVQSIGVLACFGWAFGVGYLTLKILNVLVPLRVSLEDEVVGLNIAEHGAQTELLELWSEMHSHRINGRLTQRVTVEPHSEVGHIALEYNRVLQQVDEEIERHQEIAEALRRAESRYRRIFEEAIEGIFQTSPDGHYIIANPALARIYGHDSPAELMSDITDISQQLYVDPNRRREFQVMMDRYGLVTDFESEIRRKDGSTAWISENARAVKDEAGQILYYEGTVEDITSRKRSHEMQREIDVALEASRAKSEFLAHMSHEIRTPLNGVIGMLDLLGKTNLDNKQGHYINVARSSAKLLLSLINDILDFSKIESGQLELDSHEFSLTETLEDTVDSVASQAQSKKIEVGSHIAPDVPSMLVGDSDRLRQISTNLLSNAIKFTHQGSVSLRVTVEERTDRGVKLRFGVKDTGIGIPADRLCRLFKPFSQVDASTTRRYGGTGLGLAISKKMAELLGGEMGVLSEEGKGSEFWWTARFSLQQGMTQDVAQIPDRLQKLRVLVVDRKAGSTESLYSYLADWGIEPERAHDHDSALTKIRLASAAGRPFKIAILCGDVERDSDRRLAELIKARPEGKDVRIIVITNLESVLTTEEADRLGIATQITRPIRQSRLFDSVMDSMLDRGKGISALERVAPRSVDESPVLLRQAKMNRSQSRILVAEDNEVNQFVTSEILAGEGFHCDIVSSGKQAVEAVKRGEYSLILMDCQMPEMDGFEAAAAIREWENDHHVSRDERIPIIALTASAVRGDREQCLAAGMDDYVTKPIDPIALLGVIQRFLGTTTHEKPIPTSSTMVSREHDRRIRDTDVQAASSNSTTTFNQAALLSRCSADHDFAIKLLDKLEQRLEKDNDAIKNALEIENVDALRALGHTLKGAAATVGALSLSRAAGELESAASRADAIEWKPFAQRVLDEIRKVRREIPAFRQSLAEVNSPDVEEASV